MAASAVVVPLAVGGRLSEPHRQLPKDAAQAKLWEGTHVTIETGSTPDHRHYTFEVSRGHFGDYCEFLYSTTDHVAAGQPRLSEGGGGGCGSANPASLSSDSREVSGLTATKVATVELSTVSGTVRIATKPLPAPFSARRYFVYFITAGHEPTKYVFRSADGSKVTTIPSG